MSNWTNVTVDQAMKELEEAEAILNAIEPNETQWTEREWERFRNKTKEGD